MLQRQRWTVGVIIPACNEEATIGRCVRTVIDALDCIKASQQWIVVVADGCADRTVSRARRALGDRGEVLEVAVRSAGHARRLGAARILECFAGIDPKAIWLANTDADTYVPSDWLRVQLSLADDGVTAVAGMVTLDSGASASASAAHTATYFSRNDTHTHVHGANLALRADAYLDVGGWSDLALSEDHCLWNRLRGSGWRVSSPASSVVVTSGRLVGRAPGGFADTLRAKCDAHAAVTS